MNRIRRDMIKAGGGASLLALVAAAGFVRLGGDFFTQHRGEIVNLVHHIETKAKAEHPLQRIMEIVDEHGAVLVTTTDIHLAHGIGEAVRHAYQGHLESHYNPEENLLRIHWKR